MSRNFYVQSSRRMTDAEAVNFEDPLDPWPDNVPVDHVGWRRCAALIAMGFFIMSAVFFAGMYVGRVL
jgi:hypothetical protein